MKRFLFLVGTTSLMGLEAFAQTASFDDPYSELSGNRASASCADSPDIEDCDPVSAVLAREKIDEIVSVGTMLGEDFVKNLPVPVSVLTGPEIENRNQTYISDLLRSQPGVSVNRSGPGGALTQIRVRGTEASHVLVLVDGIEVANPTAGEFDLSGIRAADVLKIEILRGEQSALYGSDAIGGVINIITRAGSGDYDWRASVEAGSFGTFEGQFNGSVPVLAGNVRIGVGGFGTNGYDISGLGGEKDGSKSRNLTLAINQDLGGINVSAQYRNSHLKTDFDEDSPFDGRLDNTISESLIDTHTARVDARFELSGFENHLSLSGHDITTDSRAGFASVSEGTRRQARWAVKRKFDHHSFTILGEVEKETYDISPNFAFAPTSPENTNYAVAGDYRGRFGGLTITGSARNDFNDRFNDAFTWNLGGSFGFDFGGRVRANLGTGVKNPSLIELFGFFPESNFVGNPALQPEESFGYGVGYSHDFGDLDVSVDYFKAELTDEIFTDFSSFPFLARNRATESEREGVELSADWKASDILSAYASATFLDTTENGIEEIRRPDFQASATVTVKPIEAVSLTASVDHTGSQLDTDFATFAPVTLDAFTLVGLNAAFDVNENVTLTLRGDNLLDEDYEEVVGYSSQGRGVYGGLRLRF